MRKESKRFTLEANNITHAGDKPITVHADQAHGKDTLRKTQHGRDGGGTKQISAVAYDAAQDVIGAPRGNRRRKEFTESESRPPTNVRQRYQSMSLCTPSRRFT